MLLEITMAKNLFWEFDTSYAKLVRHFTIVFAPTWPSYHASVIKEPMATKTYKLLKDVFSPQLQNTRPRLYS